MNKQIITSPTGERLVVLSEADFNALLEAAEDAEDRAAVKEIDRRLASGEEELIPSEIVDRLLSGENKVRVWREYRGLSVRELAQAAKLEPDVMAAIDDGIHEGWPPEREAIAKALKIDLEDL
ncbi:XRE family transcriptional regulator [Aureimonas ureilytica]|uniref:XRE family transcriptional regulator n=1 Tax=Aureimonas ureilytica TaxID=401562 RepID=A0A175R4N4_9HYPH|nr:hypothetical protein [Aureimonas ureilytica]KTQ86765.1 XRE family transcriptional regulator [Aureimonas ureilytica]